MPLAEILPVLRTLSRREKFRLVQVLLEDLAEEETPSVFPEGQIYPIHTPTYAPGAAAELSRVLAEHAGPNR